VQVDRLGEIVAARARVAGWYEARLQGESRLTGQAITPGCTKSWFVYVVRLSPDYSPDARDAILDTLRDRGIQCSNYFTPLHLEPLYRERFGFKPGDFPVCEALSARTIALPFHAALTESDVDRVVTALQAAL
jgi:perosamine synthetase